MHAIRSAPRASVFAVTAVFLIAGCGGGDETQPQQQAQPAEERPVAEITITATDGSLELPATVESAPTRFVLQNDGTKPYEAKFARLNAGVKLRDLQASLKQGPEAVFSLITLAGEVRRTAPGASGELTTELAPGSYVVVDPKYAGQGMVSPFEVVSASEATEEPPSDVEVVLGDFVIEAPSTLPSGTVSFKVANEGGQAHEFFLLEEGEKPGPSSAGVTPFNPGSTVWAEFDLEPGKYTAVCYFPDVKTGKSHAALGMTKELTVKART